jgi:hypothetical protein
MCLFASFVQDVLVEGHPDLLQDAPGGSVLFVGDAEYAVQPGLLETEAEHRQSGLRRESFAPARRRDPVENLHPRRVVEWTQSAEPDEVLPHLRDPQAEPVPIKLSDPLPDGGLSPLPAYGLAVPEEFPHRGVGPEAVQAVQIVHRNGTKLQTGGLDQEPVLNSGPGQPFSMSCSSSSFLGRALIAP